MTKAESRQQANSDRQDGNTCIALGAGVGVLGAASAVLAGAVCPLCYFVAPGLIGLGAYKRWRSGTLERNSADEKEENKT